MRHSVRSLRLLVVLPTLLVLPLSALADAPPRGRRGVPDPSLMEPAPEGYYRGKWGGLRRLDAVNPVLEEGVTDMMHTRLTPEQYANWPLEPLLIDHTAQSLAAGALPMNPPPGALFATGAVGNLFVVEGTNQLVLNVQQGGQTYRILNHNGGAAQVIANTLLAATGDHFDSIVIWTTFEDYAAAAYYAPLRNDTRGIGVCSGGGGGGQDALFGCQFDQTGGAYLQGVIFMNSVGLWRSIDQQWGLNYDEHDVASQIYATLGQESAHRYLAGLHCRDPETLGYSNFLLGRDKSHWNLKLDSFASWMDGMDWVDNGNGNFAVVADNDGFSQLDLYAMGLLPADQVEPFFFVRDARSTRLRAIFQSLGVSATDVIPDGTEELPFGWPPIDAVGAIAATGRRVDLTITDIISANGDRIPSAENAPHTFKQAFVLVTLPGQTASQVGSQLAELENVRRNWETFFGQVTGGLGQVCTDLSGECAQPQATIAGLRFSDANADNDGEWSRGETAELFLVVGNEGERTIDSVNGNLSTGVSALNIQTGIVQVSGIPAAGQVEGPTPFVVALSAELDCGVTEVTVNVALPATGTGTSPQAQDYTFAVKACPVESSSSGGGGGGGPGGVLPGPCACGSVPVSGMPLALAPMALLGVWTRRRRRQN